MADLKREGKPKIVVIGAASTSFSGLLADLAANPDLNGAELALVDIDAPNLEVMTSLGQRMVKEWGTRTTVTGTTDRRDVLKDADCIITTIAVGGVKTWRQDDDIPAKHGFGGCSVDTVGPGGLFRGLRLIPPLLEMCRDIEELCPDAWVINYSNPMTAICRAMKKTTLVKTVGLCTAGFLPRQIARFMEIEPNRVEVVSGGVNHWVWALKILVDGKDAYQEFTDRMRSKHTNAYYGSSVELLDLFGCWPMPGANHVAEYFPYFYGDEPADGRSDEKYQFRTGHDFDERLKKDKEQRELLKKQAEGKEDLGHKPEESGGEAVRMLCSMWYNRRTLHYANVQNDGIIPNLPDHCIVEVPCIADAAGIRGTQVGPLPASVVGLVQAREAFFELLADAAIHKSKNIALQCLMADTNTISIPRARACLEEMFEVQKEFLPGFK